jgi:peptide-methionine (S)-S-oxide reductase
MKKFFLAAAFAATALTSPAEAQQRTDLETAILAGGCFWCVEADFDKIEGVVSTTSGYTGGTVENPTYKQVTAGGTGHYEAVRIVYDPAKVGYRQLIDHFWRTVDPTDAGGQFCDRGESYRTAVFAHSPEQRQAAEASKQQADQELKGEIVTPVLEASAFYPAEDYHQDYYEKNPLRYQYYRWSCGRDQRLEELWGDAAAKTG